MEQTFTYVDETGKQVVCSVVSILPYEGHSYILYTDGSLEDDGSLTTYLEEFKIVDNQVQLIPIMNDALFEKVSSLMEVSYEE